MRIVVGLALLASGCIADHTDSGDPKPTVQPRTCSSDITLDGNAGNSAMLGPMMLDANGVSVCLHLDATHNLASAHFAASTGYATGTTSPFTTVLQDPSFVTIQDGWDVTVSETAPRTFTNLEWNAPLHQVTDATLWIRSHDAAATATTVNVTLFEPFE